MKLQPGDKIWLNSNEYLYFKGTTHYLNNQPVMAFEERLVGKSDTIDFKKFVKGSVTTKNYLLVDASKVEGLV